MNTYRVQSHGPGYGYSVLEHETHRLIAIRETRESAQAHADLLDAEHANGRVAQAVCALGHRCDRDRIVEPEWLGVEQLQRLVLCERHEAETRAQVERGLPIAVLAIILRHLSALFTMAARRRYQAGIEAFRANAPAEAS